MNRINAGWRIPLWCIGFFCAGVLAVFVSCEYPKDNKDTETFTNGELTLTASTSETGGSRTVVVTDADDSTVVSVEATISGGLLTLPDGSTHLIELDEPLDGLPSSYELNRAAVFLAHKILGDPEGEGRVAALDAPGCDLMYDFECMIGCCADHDQCFDEYGCRAFSWSLIYDSEPECRNCNDEAFACILGACYRGETPKQSGTCYDNRCDMYYDCPSGYCDCTSPCDLEICDNDKDDDGDGIADCDDANCSGHTACIEICDNDCIDDDGDLLADCDDADCADDPACIDSGNTCIDDTSTSSTTTSVAAQQELRWVLTKTEANPNDETTAFAGGTNGYPDGWYTDPRYAGKTQTFDVKENSISMQDRHVDHEFEYHNVTLTSSFATPPTVLVPQEPLTFDVTFSHDGTVTEGDGTGLTFIYLLDGRWPDSMPGYCYTPWSTNCSDVPSTSFDISIPYASYEGDEFQLGVGWLNCAACYVVWTYTAYYDR